MPYTIETSDGIVINNIPDNILSDSQELKDRVASLRSGRAKTENEAVSEVTDLVNSQITSETPVSATEKVESFFSPAKRAELAAQGRVGGFNPNKYDNGPVETLPQALARTARIATPIGVGLASGGLGLVPAAIATGIGGYTGELGGQLIEGASGLRQDLDPNAVNLAGISNLAPNVGREAGAIRAFAGNIGGAVGATEVGNYVSNPTDRQPPNNVDEFLSRYSPLNAVSDFTSQYASPEGLRDLVNRSALTGGIITGTTALSSAGGRLADLNAKKKSISAGRGGGTVMLGEVIENWTQNEGKQLAKGNAKALASYNGALAKVSNNLVGELSKYADGKAAKSVIDTIVLNNIVNPEQINELIERVTAAKGFKDEATKKALQQSVKAFADRAVPAKIYSAGIPQLSTIEQTGVAGGIAQDLQVKADSIAATKVSEMYDLSGIGMDTPVVSRQDVLNNIQNNKSIAADDKENLSTAIIGLFGDKETLSLSEYRKARDVIAGKAIINGAPPSAAKRVASQGFSAIKDASESFLKQTVSEDQFLTFNKANNLAKSRFDALDSNAIDLMEAGNTEALYNNVRTQGKSNVSSIDPKKFNATVSDYDGLMKYANMLEETAGVEVASQYRSDVHLMLREGAFRNSLKKIDGRVSPNATYDHAKLVNEFETLRRAGIDIKQLGIGNVQDIRDMSRAFGIAGFDTVRSSDVSTFIKITSMGGDYSKYRKAFDDLRQTFIEGKGSPTPAEINKVLKRAEGAGLSETALQEAYDAANNDPLTQLLRNPNQGGSGPYALNRNDLTQNVKFTESLMEMETEDVRKFANALRESGRSADLDTLAKTSATNALFLFEDFSTNAKPAVKASNVANTFFGQDARSIKLRNNLKVLMGDAAYKNMLDKFVNPAGSFVQYTQKLVGYNANNADVIKGLVSIKGLLTGGTTAGTLYANAVTNAVSLSGRIGYGLTYELILGKYSDDFFAKAGGSVSKWASAKPVNAIIVNLALRNKEMEAQAKAQQQTQESPQ